MISRVWKIVALIVLFSVLLAACSLRPNDTTATPTDEPIENGGSGQVIPTVVSVPDAGKAARQYLSAWKNFEYNKMYNRLTTISKDSIQIEDFTARYTDVANEAVLTAVDYEILQVFTTPQSAQVGYKVLMDSALVGVIERQTQMNLTLEDGAWRVVWDDTLILPELAGGRTLSMESIPPTRGIIYDRDGNTLAADVNAVAIKVIPSEMEDDQAGRLLAQLQTVTGITSTYLSAKIFSEDAPYLVSVAELSADRFDEREPYLANHYNVLSWADYFTRLSYLGEGNAHTVGWVGAIPAEDVDTWRQRGYPVDAIVGRMGIEQWGQDLLSGKRSADLYVVNLDGTVHTKLAAQEAEPSQSIYTTLDDNLQFWAQLSLQGFKGAVVVMEKDTGRVLAMASSPAFDPNDADLNNPNSEWGNYFPDNDGYFFNRATQGQYPPGSIFKVITLSAALESGLYDPNNVYFCDHHWYGPDGVELDDWTLDKDLNPSGDLTLIEGLMRSCNPWFYQIGYTLYNNGNETRVADLSRGFGLGSETGIDVLPEEPGQITNPADNTTAQPWFNAVQQAIGQSDTLITPLQAAVYVAALGNGGILYKPQLIERVENTAGENTFEFEPIVNGTLPISEDTLEQVRQGMLLVTQNSRGTAYRTFVNRPIKTYGKTGTAQNPGIDAHAWFIGFTDVQNEDRPDIAIAVLVENIGDGSEFAAPIFRRVAEVYFFGNPQNRYPWEVRVGEINPKYFLSDEELDALDNENGGNN